MCYAARFSRPNHHKIKTGYHVVSRLLIIDLYYYAFAATFANGAPSGKRAFISGVKAVSPSFSL